MTTGCPGDNAHVHCQRTTGEECGHGKRTGQVGGQNTVAGRFFLQWLVRCFIDAMFGHSFGARGIHASRSGPFFPPIFQRGVRASLPFPAALPGVAQLTIVPYAMRVP